MANAFRISNARAIVMCDGLVDAIDVTPPGTIQIRTGSAPADVETTASGTLLATLTFSNPAFGGAADINPGARATASAITGDSSADATGTAEYFRILNGAGTAIAQGTCGTSSSDMVFNSVAITSGSAVNITAMTITVPEI